MEDSTASRHEYYNSSADEDEENWSSYDSETDCSVSVESAPDWEKHIDLETGQLIYIGCYPPTVQHKLPSTNDDYSPIFHPDAHVPSEPDHTLTRNAQTRKSSRSKFLRLLRGRDSGRMRSRKQMQKSSSNPLKETCTTFAETSSKVTFSDYQEGEIKLVNLEVFSGRDDDTEIRASLVESLLGIMVCPFPDRNRVMIAGIVPDTAAAREKNIKIGDWLRRVDGTDVNIYNINNVIETLVHGPTVTLELQRVTGVEITNQPPPTSELQVQSDFVRKLIGHDCESDQVGLSESHFCVAYIDTKTLSELGPEFEGVCYAYPYPFRTNRICNSRGIFITLQNLIADIVGQSPTTTRFHVVNERICTIAYRCYNSELLMLMLPCQLHSAAECIMEQFVVYLEFLFGSVPTCMKLVPKARVDHFISRFMSSLSSVQDLSREFEQVQAQAHLLSLPMDAQMQIDEALNELEASDYREWNQDPLDCQRLFTILGSALFHSHYVLSTHLQSNDLGAINVFLQRFGFFELSRRESPRKLIFWRQVFSGNANELVNGKRYLLIVGKDKDLLVALMEVGGCTETADDSIGPDSFYVEEAEATLSHLQELGIAELAMKWRYTNRVGQIAEAHVPYPQMSSKRNDLLGQLTTKSGNDNLRKAEVTSILKKRDSDLISTAHNSMSNNLEESDSDDISDNRSSEGNTDERANDVDQKFSVIMGRRATRKLQSCNYAGNTNDDASDIDEYRDGSQLSGGSFDLAEIRHRLLSETGCLQPMRLTVGSGNSLYHYVSLSSLEGIVILPTEPSGHIVNLQQILQNFPQCCHRIHRVFQNASRFKTIPYQDAARSVLNKSLIAIKEYGIYFETTAVETDSAKKPIKLNYCVVGRLFHMPYTKEFFVCYDESIPQNMVEVAFKLNISNNI